jgi:hypothetical protein
VRPLIYGYLRVGDEPDQEVLDAEQALRDFAEVEGYCLAAIFHEVDPGSQRAFLALAEELTRAEARDVVVPSLAHLAGSPVLRRVMLTHLEYRAEARLWVLARP